jgi:hypothetical protein
VDLLSTFIVAVFCLVDDQLKGRRRLRQRGPAPKLSGAEVLTIERSSGSSWGSTLTRTSTSSSEGTTLHGSLPSVRYIGPHSR